MTIISVNTALPRMVRWMGKEIPTGIFKEPAEGRFVVRSLNIEGDRQADLRVHGGADKAVYGYAAEHYALWREELRGRELPWGMFGENLTVAGGLDEESVCVGDRFSAGTAELIAVQPRLPCFKLGIRFGNQRFIGQFAASGRLGVYFRVAAQGEVGRGDRFTRIAREGGGLTIGALGRILLAEELPERSVLLRAAREQHLPARMRARFEELAG